MSFHSLCLSGNYSLSFEFAEFFGIKLIIVPYYAFNILECSGVTSNLPGTGNLCLLSFLPDQSD